MVIFIVLKYDKINWLKIVPNLVTDCRPCNEIVIIVIPVISNCSQANAITKQVVEILCDIWKQ